MSNLFDIIKENIKTILITILVYQLILTIFFFSVENLVLLAIFITIVAGISLFSTYKDDIKSIFKK